MVENPKHPWSPLTIRNKESTLAVVREDTDDHPQWERYLTLYEEKAFYLGSLCETCPVLFERMVGASGALESGAFSQSLAAGLTDIETPLIEEVKSFFPAGDYLIGLHTLQPKLVVPGQADDYFSQEQPSQWGVDPFWGLPHNPRTEYYRHPTKILSQDNLLFEFTVPMFPKGWLDPERLAWYQERIRAEKMSTAVSFSLLDVKTGGETETELSGKIHWALTHFLVDGHVKVYAAALAGKPVNMLSFVALDHGASTVSQVEKVLDQLHQDPVPEGGQHPPIQEDHWVH